MKFCSIQPWYFMPIFSDALTIINNKNATCSGIGLNYFGFFRFQNKFKNFKIIDGNLNWNDYDLIFPVADLHEGKI
jgi:hypothetical protein